MRTLVELYGAASLSTNPEISDILFKRYADWRGNGAPDPEAIIKGVAKDMKTKSDELLAPFMEAWQIRLSTAISNELDKGTDVRAIPAKVGWITEGEYKALLGIIDQYIASDEDTAFALKITDLVAIMQMLKQTSLQILMHMAPAPVSIDTPFSNPDGTPKIEVVRK